MISLNSKDSSSVIIFNLWNYFKLSSAQQLLEFCGNIDEFYITDVDENITNDIQEIFLSDIK